MSRGVLDTSVLIAAGVEPLPGELAISVISLAELHYGVLVAKSEDIRAVRLARPVGLQKRFDPLPVDEAVADSYGRLAARVVNQGRQPRGRLWTCSSLLLRVLTRPRCIRVTPRTLRGSRTW